MWNSKNVFGRYLTEPSLSQPPPQGVSCWLLRSYLYIDIRFCVHVLVSVYLIRHDTLSYMQCFADRCLSFFFWSLCCLSFDLRILITQFGIFKLFICSGGRGRGMCGAGEYVVNMLYILRILPICAYQFSVSRWKIHMYVNNYSKTCLTVSCNILEICYAIQQYSYYFL